MHLGSCAGSPPIRDVARFHCGVGNAALRTPHSAFRTIPPDTVVPTAAESYPWSS